MTGASSSNAPLDLDHGFPEWLDQDARRKIWNGCRAICADCTIEEVKRAVSIKTRLLGAKTTTGLIIHSVPKMFEGAAGIHHHLRRELAQQREALQQLAEQQPAEQPRVEASDVTAAVTPDKAPVPPVGICDRCGSDGVLNGVVLAAWCDCSRARERRRAKPNYVEVLNRSAWRSGPNAAALHPRPPQRELDPTHQVAVAAGGAR